MDRSTLVTGARGFVGPHLLTELGASGTASAVDVTKPDDVAAAIKTTKPAALAHLAAKSSVADSWRRGADVWIVNVVGTVNVLDAVRNESGDTRVLVVSSGEVYGETLERPALEDDAVRPISPYAASKVGAEVAAERAARVDGLDVIVVRPFQHVGPGQDARFAIGSWTGQIAALEREGGGVLHVGDLTVERDLLDVRDVARAYVALLERSVRPGVYNVSTGKAVAFEEVVRTLVGLARCRIDVAQQPRLKRPVEIRRLVGDPSRLMDATGWKPSFSLEATLRDALDAARRSLQRASAPS